MTFRPYLLACVRQAALDRARAAGRAEPGSTRPRGARRPRPLPRRPLRWPVWRPTARSSSRLSSTTSPGARWPRSRSGPAPPLWLSDVEAMTPGEVGGILGSSADVVVSLADGARAELRAARDAAHGRHEVRADCRFTVDHLGAYHAGTLDPKKGVLVRSHLDLCPPCRMRLGELANAPATLAAAVPAAPLLGGEAQQHWLTSAAGSPPRRSPPGAGLAAAAPDMALPRRPRSRSGSPDPPCGGDGGRAAGLRPARPGERPGGRCRPLPSSSPGSASCCPCRS